MTVSSIFYFLRRGLVVTALAALVACGGGGGGSSDNSGAKAASPTTGQVAILFTDAPSDQFCQILATVERVDLLGSSGSPTNVFMGPETIDILSLRNYTDLFAIDAFVPIGTYEKVRLTLSDLALVECDAQGNPEPAAGWEHPRLPGNGKLDLNPRGSFEVIGGETLVIELDMDMEKSLHVHQTGNGKWQFRPVIFVTISPDGSKLVRVFGQARIVGSMDFELCPIEPASSVDNGSSTPGTECLGVFTDAATGIFDESGTRVGMDAVASGDLLTAIGFLSLYDNADGDTRMDNLRLDAAVIELGDLGTFARITGEVVSAPGNNDLFVFDPTPLDDATNAIDVLLQSGTRIFALGSNAELTSAALQPGTTGQVDGVFTTPPAGEPLKSSLIVLDQDTTPAVALLDAVIQAPIPTDDDAVAETRRFLVDTDTLNDKCVKVDAGTRYLLITETASTSETTEITFADLAAGDLVDVFGADDAVDSECVLADTVQKYVTAP
ncbi:MAG: DUF4382 domain-containing protein [Steroidobacteraceae bacterium]|nr:DUF4382 domain-containing protein [Steroidobacteraceae bacterium]